MLLTHVDATNYGHAFIAVALRLSMCSGPNIELEVAFDNVANWAQNKTSFNEGGIRRFCHSSKGKWAVTKGPWVFALYGDYTSQLCRDYSKP